MGPCKNVNKIIKIILKKINVVNKNSINKRRNYCQFGDSPYAVVKVSEGGETFLPF